MEIILSFDIGAYSTKVSFIGQGSEKPIITREFINAILFTPTSEKFYGQEALQKIQEQPEKHGGSLITNFYQLLHTNQSEFLQSDENYYTYTKVKANPGSERLTFKLNHSGKMVTPEKCLTYFLAFIRRKILDEFFGDPGPDHKLKALICVNDNSSCFERLLLSEIFLEAGFASNQFIFRGLALSFLYTKLHNYLVNRKVFFMDIGYSAIKLMVLSISPQEISMVESKTISLGLRDFDFEIYLHILSDLKAKYGIDYQKDKYVRFSIMSRIGKLKKAFALNSSVVLNLQNTFGSRYFDQCIKIDYSKYKSLNRGNFDKFKREIKDFVTNTIQAKGIYIDDFQVVGGGSKLKTFIRASKAALETNSMHDKIVNIYSCSQGALLQSDFKVERFAKLYSPILFEFTLPDEKQKNTELATEELAAEKITAKSSVIHEGKELPPEAIGNDSLVDHLTEEHSIKDSQYPDIALKKKAIGKIALPDADVQNRASLEKSPVIGKASPIKESLGEKPLLIPVAPSGILFSDNERISLSSNTKRLELPADFREPNVAVELTISYSESKGKYSNRIIILKQKISDPFESIDISFDSGLLLKPLILQPSGIEKPAEIFRPNEFEVSKISKFDPPPQRINDHTDIVINVDFKEAHSDHSHHTDSSQAEAQKRNPLINATFFHLIGDFIQDLALLVTGIILYFKPEWEIMDPILSIVLAIFVLFFVVRYTYHLFVRLMETCPPEISYQKLLSQLIGISGILEVHDLHVWDLANKKLVATAHVVCNEDKEKVLREATLLFRSHKIYHSTLQIESPAGKNDALYINCDNNIDMVLDKS